MNPSGAPIEVATITVAPNAAGAGPVSQEANVTDAQGRYFYPLPPGRWELTVTAYGYSPLTTSVVVRDGELEIHNVVLELSEG
jgi:hypothetical protein